MTPKEKAQYIFDIYTNYVGEYDVDKHAKQCALIAVDEILNEFPSQCPKESYEMERHLFWQEVKQELEKL
jgi:hypothetical protein